MRLTKIINKIVAGGSTIIGYDDFGRPIYNTSTTLVPIEAEIEPYSEELAKTDLGLIVSVTNRCFCYINNGLKVGDKVRYKDKDYNVTFILEYDRHNEVLIKKI